MDPESDDWEVARELQPNTRDYAFDLSAALASVVTVASRVPSSAFTAASLGTERVGNGVVIAEAGVVLTIGYLITEAEEVSLISGDGKVTPGHVLGYDQATGFGLLQALEPLALPALQLADSRYATPGEPVVVAGAGGRRRSMAARVVARQEFAGYWEYLIEEAIFTSPAHPNWGGAALIGSDGRLLGIGSLQLQHQAPGGRVVPLNMSVPVELLEPIYDDLLAGRPDQRPRPWLGIFAQEEAGEVTIVGFAGEGPGRRAGLREGDVVRKAGGMDITNLPDLYRSVWALGQPGVEAPLTVQRGGDTFQLSVITGDRRSFLKRRRLH